MFEVLRQKHCVRVCRNDVMVAMRVMDPIRVESRKLHKTVRGQSDYKGPNFLWGLDQNDKLKRYTHYLPTYLPTTHYPLPTTHYPLPVMNTGGVTVSTGALTAGHGTPTG
jgi:hypothetical protein